MQPPSAYHVLVRTANDMVVVEGQASALSLRYEERPKRIPLLIRLPREVARCLALKGTQQPTMMNDQQQRVLVSVRGGEGGLGLTSRLRFLGPDGYSGPWYRCVQSFEFRFRLLLRECNSHVHVLPRIRNTWRVRVGAAHGIMFGGFGMGSSVLQRWVPVWPVLVRA
jgi:hypothetical protein